MPPYIVCWVMSPGPAAVGLSGMQLDEIYVATAGRLVAQLYGLTGDFAETQDVGGSHDR
jgi:hypothetical protein